MLKLSPPPRPKLVQPTAMWAGFMVSNSPSDPVFPLDPCNGPVDLLDERVPRLAAFGNFDRASCLPRGCSMRVDRVGMLFALTPSDLAPKDFLPDMGLEIYTADELVICSSLSEIMEKGHGVMFDPESLRVVSPLTSRPLVFSAAPVAHLGIAEGAFAVLADMPLRIELWAGENADGLIQCVKGAPLDGRPARFEMRVYLIGGLVV